MFAQVVRQGLNFAIRLQDGTNLRSRFTGNQLLYSDERQAVATITKNGYMHVASSVQYFGLMIHCLTDKRVLVTTTDYKPLFSGFEFLTTADAESTIDIHVSEARNGLINKGK